MKLKQLFSYIAVLLIILLGFLAFQNRQQLSDWWVLRSYVPTPIVESLATNSGMNQNGRNLFYVSDPALNNKEEFNINCEFPERSLVLGCYDGTNIFILDIDQKELEGVEEVTAAHEMLHAAYKRLSSSEQARVDTLLNDQFIKIDNPRITELIEEYRDQDPTVVSNELHSILATELEQLSPELEEYYNQYFEDRLKVVVAAENYEAVFVEIENKINDYDNKLSSIQSQITNLEAKLTSAKARINQERAILDGLIAQNKIPAYNSRVPGFNSMVSSYNSDVETLKIYVSDYNNIVVKRNNIALQQNDLIKSLDSNFQTVE